MKKNNLIDFLIILLVTIGIACLPFNLFIKENWLVLLLQIVMQILVNLFIIWFAKKKTKLSLQNGEIRWKNFLILLPVFLVCFTNYLYLLTTNNFGEFRTDWTIIFEIILAFTIVVNEELVFRLLFISNLEKPKIISKMFISAGVFAACHLTTFFSTFNPADLIQVLYTFWLGLLLAFMFMFTKSIYPCIALHFLFNVFNQIFISKIATQDFQMVMFILMNAIPAIFVGAYVVIILLTKKKELE